MLPVTTDRLVLRAFSESDLDDLHDIQRRPDVTRFLLWDSRTLAQTRAALAKRVEQTELRAEGDNLAIAVVLRDSGTLIGDFNLEWLSADLGRAEIGFVMHPDHAGKGYATEAGHEVLRIAFEKYAFHRVIGLCNGENHASQRLMERLGMRREAYFRQSEILKGQRVDLAVHAILADEWADRVRKS